MSNQDHVGVLVAGERDRAEAVARQGGHADVVLGVQQGPEPRADQLLVVG
jgi:hypothetical protein